MPPRKCATIWTFTCFMLPHTVLQGNVRLYAHTSTYSCMHAWKHGQPWMGSTCRCTLLVIGISTWRWSCADVMSSTAFHLYCTIQLQSTCRQPTSYQFSTIQQAAPYACHAWPWYTNATAYSTIYTHCLGPSRVKTQHSQASGVGRWPLLLSPLVRKKCWAAAAN
jgi:hypothetical protein